MAIGKSTVVPAAIEKTVHIWKTSNRSYRLMKIKLINDWTHVTTLNSPGVAEYLYVVSNENLLFLIPKGYETLKSD